MFEGGKLYEKLCGEFMGSGKKAEESGQMHARGSPRRIDAADHSGDTLN